MSKNYTGEALADVIASDFDPKTAAVKFNIPSNTIRQYRREPSLNVCAGRLSYFISDQRVLRFSIKTTSELWFDATKDLSLQHAADYFKSLDLTTQLGM